MARRMRLVGPVVLALGVAEVAARLLAPREPRAPRGRVDLHTYFSAEEIERGRRFGRPQLALMACRGAVETLALGAFVRKPPKLLEPRPSRPVLSGAAAGSGLSVALTLPPLPLRAVARQRALNVGLVTQPWRGWAVDLVKSAAIEAALAGFGGGAVVAITRRWPQRWWMPASVGSVLFGGALATIAPVLLDPIFNDFTPLEEGETRTDVLALADAAGVRVKEVYSVDASRRTTAANAYVTGLGPTKRVVLFDTLLDRYTRDEIRVVVAHELAHVRGRDVLRGLGFAAAVAPALALAAQRLSWALSGERGSASALPALAFAAGAVSAPIGLIGNRMSRAMERNADQASLELTGAVDAFIALERRLALQNVADLDPPRWLSSVLSTHPTTIERIGAALAWAERQGVPDSNQSATVQPAGAVRN